MDTYKFSERKKKIELELDFPSISAVTKQDKNVLDYSWMKNCVHTEIQCTKVIKPKVSLPKPPKMILFKTKDQYDWTSVPYYFFPSY